MADPIRAKTTEEIALLREDGQQCQLFMAVFKPSTVFTAQVDGDPISNNGITSVKYNNESGDYTDIIPGMEMWVGSTAGANDLGSVRIRAGATIDTIFIGETSDVVFADEVYLTVKNQYNLWPKHLFYDGSNWNMDHDIPYTDQYNNPTPIPVMGPTMACLWLPTSGSATLTMDATNSWVPGTATISAYSWACDGASISSSVSGSPTFTFTSSGSYIIRCTVTASNGQTNTGYRYAMVFDDNDMPTSAFTMDNCSGEYQNGGWTCSVTLYDQATLNDIYDGALVAVFARDYFSGSVVSIGQVSGYENIIMTGWVDGQTMDYSGEIGKLSFTIRNAAGWLDKLQSYPFSMKATNEAANNWIYIDELNTDLCLWQLCHWRSTIDTVIDVYPSGDTRYLAGMNVSAGSIFWQLKETGYPIFAEPLADHLNRLFFYVNSQMLLYADRSAIPEICSLSKNDWTGEISITRNAQTVVSTLDVSGVAWNINAITSGVQPVDWVGVPIYSRYPGISPNRWGKAQTKDRLAFTDQTQANNLCGLLGGWQNNEYPQLTVSLAANDRFYDIAPYQYVLVTLEANDTPRGISFTDKRFIPRRVSLRHDPKAGMLTTDLTMEAETSQLSSTTIIKPVVVLPGIGEFPTISIAPFVPPATTWFPSSIVPTTPSSGSSGSGCNDIENGPYPLYFEPAGRMNPGDEKYAWLPCTLRASDNVYLSKIEFDAAFGFDAGSYFNIDAVDSNKNTIVTGTPFYGSPFSHSTFAPVSDTSISGFKFSLSTSGSQTSSGSGVWFDSSLIKSFYYGPDPGTDTHVVPIGNEWKVKAGNTWIGWALLFSKTGSFTWDLNYLVGSVTGAYMNWSFGYDGGYNKVSKYFGDCYPADNFTNGRNLSIALWPDYTAFAGLSPVSCTPISNITAINYNFQYSASITLAAVHFIPAYIGEIPSVTRYLDLYNASAYNICGA